MVLKSLMCLPSLRNSMNELKSKRVIHIQVLDAPVIA